MRIAISYSNRSSVSGRALLDALRASSAVAYAFRARDGQMTLKTTCAVVWGERRAFYAPNATTWINTPATCGDTVDKARMLATLHGNGVPLIDYVTLAWANDAEVDAMRDRTGHFYVRDRFGVTRYDNTTQSGDLYVSKPVPYKRREYRVHVFDGQVFAAYEKCPHDDVTRPKLFKADNCAFRSVRLDGTARLTNDGMQVALAAVDALQLTYGAVDLIRDKRGRFTVCEVNSSAGLNTHNINRLASLIVAKALEDAERAPHERRLIA